MFTVDIVNMTQTLQHPYQPQWREEPPPLPPQLRVLSLLRPALLLQAAMSISLFLGTIPLSGLNPLALALLVPVGIFIVVAVRVAHDPSRRRSVRWLRRLEKVWIVHFVLNLLLAAFVAGMWLNPTQFVTGLLYPFWILKMTKEYTNVVPH